MHGEYLSFVCDRFQDRGTLVLVEFEQAFQEAGYDLDYEGRVDAGDWWFRARGLGREFFVVLVIGSYEPPHWWMYLEGLYDDLCADDKVNKEAQPLLERVATSLAEPGTVCWHEDHTTLPRP